MRKKVGKNKSLTLKVRHSQNIQNDSRYDIEEKNKREYK